MQSIGPEFELAELSGVGIQNPLHLPPQCRLLNFWPVNDAQFTRQPGFYIAMKCLTPSSCAVPFKTTRCLNGPDFIEHQLTQASAGFRKNDNAFWLSTMLQHSSRRPTC
jgi:hypothetical protein